MQESSLTPTPSPAPSDSKQAESFMVAKQTLTMFVVTEFCVYLSQILMFFLVAVMASNLLRDEAHLVAYIKAKLNDGSLTEVLATLLAIAATMGFISALTRAAPSSELLQRVADEVLSDAPRTAYVFGSGVAGTLFAVALFLHNQPESQAVTAVRAATIALMWSVIGFAYGCGFAYAFKHKTHIKKKTARSSSAA